MKVSILNLFILCLVVLFGCAQKNEDTDNSIFDEEHTASSLKFGNTSHVLNVRGLLSENNIPSFSWYDAQGQEVTLESYKGKVIVINFWATWCPPCKQEIPYFIDIYNKYKSQGVEILGISLDSQLDLDELSDFVVENEINYQIVLDDSDLEHAFGGIEAIPTTFIIGKDFKPKTKHVGLLNEAGLEKLINSEL